MSNVQMINIPLDRATHENLKRRALENERSMAREASRIIRRAVTHKSQDKQFEEGK